MPDRDTDPAPPPGDPSDAQTHRDTVSFHPADSSPTETPAAPAHCPDVPPELAGHPRYEILELLGAGGMGCVYKAWHRFMHRPVALKIINHSLLNQPAMIARFLQEVRAAARLTHPNIVRAYDADQVGQTYFLVMEYVPGVTLDRVLTEQGRLPVPLACEYARQAALGLQHAYEQGMVHRDIKPHNLMLTEEGQVKILDFGLARYATEVAATVLGRPADFGATPEQQTPRPAAHRTGDDGPTRPGQGEGELHYSYPGIGTPDYMAPEEILDARQADIRADIYSLGCTLYRCLSGRVPFPGSRPVEKLRAHLYRQAEPLTALGVGVSPELARAVERMMAKEAARRPQTPAEVAQEMARFAGAARPHILIVDDEADSRQFLAMALEYEGYSVSCAANGREALDRLREPPRPDLILLDMLMPVMDGYQFLAELHRRPEVAAIPVVILSGAEQARARAFALGIVDFLKKPLPVEELAQKIRQYTSAN